MSFNRQGFANALLNATPHAVIYSDEQSRIRFWNKGAERIFGFAEAEAFGQSLTFLNPVLTLAK
jgi:PAS domain S-box-containing protein